MGKTYLPRLLVRTPEYLVDAFVASATSEGHLQSMMVFLCSRLLEVLLSLVRIHVAASPVDHAVQPRPSWQRNLLPPASSYWT